MDKKKYKVGDLLHSQDENLSDLLVKAVNDQRIWVKNKYKYIVMSKESWETFYTTEKELKKLGYTLIKD